VRSLNSKIDDFEYNLRYQMQSSSAGSRQVGNSSDVIRGLKDSIDAFQQNYVRKRENRDDVNAIVDAARRVDTFLLSSQTNRQVQEDWTGAKRQIDRLASNYGVNVNWNGSSASQPQRSYDPVITSTQGQYGSQSVGLSGTYDLDTAASENVNNIVADLSIGNEQKDDLKDKLAAPAQIAIDIRGNQVTLATSNAASVTFMADGRDKVETSASGKSLRLRATLSGQTLTVSSLGGETDYTVVFTSLSNGRSLKVSRRITTEYLSQTVFAESVYNKTDSQARLNIGGGSSTTTSNNGTSTSDPNGSYSDNDQSVRTSNGQAPTTTNVRPGNYIIQNGAIITAVLENEINTGVSQNNDRFKMTVQSPTEFRGAVIEGYLTGVGRSGKVTGRSNVTFNFQKITLRDGQSYDFAGNLQSVRDAYGKVVKIDNEGTAQGTDQTRESVKRGGIGGGLGAIIGAIAGGAKGAAIGAIIGAGGGAGTVAVQGRDDVRLQVGSTVTIQASAPNNRYPDR
jgi:hypothetical protein